MLAFPQERNTRSIPARLKTGKQSRENPGLLFPAKPTRHTIMETELIGVLLGAVLPIYPILYAIHQRIGRYDEVVEEFKRLRQEHEQWRGAYHGR